MSNHPTLNFIHGDCILEMAKIEENSIDVVITSPPYNLNMDYSTYKDKIHFDDYLKWTNQWMSEVFRLLTPQGSFFLNVDGSPKNPWIPFDIANEARKLRFILQNKIIWVKSIRVDEFTKGHAKPINSPRFLNVTNEFIFHFTKSGKVPLRRYDDGVGTPISFLPNLKRWNTGRTNACNGNTWFIPYKTIKSREENKNHPAIFPVELPERCLRLIGDAAQKVLDPFGGIGTTALACKNLGRSCISIDLDLEYTEMAKERCEII